MQAIQITGPGAFAHGSLPRPVPAPGEALIRVTATGLCGTDLELAHGSHAYYTAGRARYPIVPGHEWAGIVETLPPGVTGFCAGDQVVGECALGCSTCPRCRVGAYHTCEALRETGILNKDGGFAEWLCAPISALHPVPAHIAPHIAALVEPCAVALNGVRRSGAAPGHPLTIFGDGAIGLLALLVARALGIGPVTVVGATPARLALATTLGADTRMPGDSPRLSSHILEATGNPDAVTAALAALAPGGTLALLGLFGGKPLVNLPIDQLVIGDRTLTGVLGSPHLWPETIALIADGRLDPAPIVTHRLPLAEFETALHLAETRQAIKSVLHPVAFSR